MTILSVFDAVSKEMGEGAQTALVSNTDPFAVEMLALANEVAPDIAKRHDWNLLLTLNTQAGDAVTTAFALPADYDRMPVKAKVFLASSKQPMLHVIDLDEWLSNRLLTAVGSGEWTLIGGQIHIFPAMAASDSAKFYYVSNLIVDPVSGANKTSFTIDTDVFRLPERLLKLGLKAKWRQTKGLDYAQDFSDFEMALAQEITRDKGSRMIAVGRPRLPDDVKTAYPGTITP